MQANQTSGRDSLPLQSPADIHERTKEGFVGNGTELQAGLGESRMRSTGVCSSSSPCVAHARAASRSVKIVYPVQGLSRILWALSGFVQSS